MVITSKPSSIVTWQKTYHVSCTPTITSSKARSSVWNKNTSCAPLLFKISSAGSNPRSSEAARPLGLTSSSSPKKSQFNWTTLIQLWRFQNSWGFWSMLRNCHGKKLGTWPSRLALTPITPFCPKLWRGGPSHCCRAFFRDIWRLFTTLTSCTWRRLKRNGLVIGTDWGACL